MNIFDQEKLLLEGLATDDKAVIERIYRDNYPMVQSMIINNNGTIDDAADIFQEGMIVIYQKAQQVDFELNCQLKTYIYSVCRRLWLKKLQQAQRFGNNADLGEDVVAVEEDLDYHEQKQHEFNIMESALAKIGEPCKSLLEAYYLQKKGMQEIAANFGYSNADNAKTQKYKCLVRLKKLFFSEYKTKE